MEARFPECRVALDEVTFIDDLFAKQLFSSYLDMLDEFFVATDDEITINGT